LLGADKRQPGSRYKSGTTINYPWQDGKYKYPLPKYIMSSFALIARKIIILKNLWKQENYQSLESPLLGNCPPSWILNIRKPVPLFLPQLVLAGTILINPRNFSDKN